MAKSKASDESLEVIPLVPVFGGTREFPKVSAPHVKTTAADMELDPDPTENARLVKELIDNGKVMKVTTALAEAPPEEIAAVVAEAPPA